MTATAACSAEGELLVYDFQGDFNTGAYSSWGPTVANRVPIHASGPYRVPNVRALTRAVLTNNSIAGAFRGFGVPQSTVVGEALLDELAQSCGIDPLEFRYRNNPRVTTLPHAITAENVAERFAAAGVPEEPDILSIDIDGNDYWIWKAIDGYRPRIVIIEYNSALDPAVALVQPYGQAQGWDHSSGYSASLAALELVAQEKGYRLAHTESIGANAFFVREDLASGLPTEVPRRAANFGFSGAGWHPAPKRAPVWHRP